MDGRVNYREHIDPEYRRWGRKYPRFPGVVECLRLVRDGKATGAWADIVVDELAHHASDCYTELVESFRSEANNRVRVFVLMALEIAALPESVSFLVEILKAGNPHFVPHAERGLQAIGTSESRSALWQVRQR
jgi:hypothetical protein